MPIFPNGEILFGLLLVVVGSGLLLRFAVRLARARGNNDSAVIEFIIPWFVITAGIGFIMHGRGMF
jgi:hypothetical protein